MAFLLGAAVVGGAYLLSSSEPSQCLANNDTDILASLLCKASASAVSESTIRQYVKEDMVNERITGFWVTLCQGNRVSVSGKLGSSSTISQTVNQDQNISATLQQVASASSEGDSHGQDTEANNTTRINLNAAAESTQVSSSKCAAQQEVNMTMTNKDIGGFSVTAVQGNDITLNLLAECMHNIAQDTQQAQGLVIDVTQDASAYQKGSTLGGFVTQIFVSVILGLIMIVVVFAAIASVKYLQIVLLSGIGVGYIVCTGFSYIKFMGSVVGMTLDNRRSESVYDCERNRHDCEVSRRRFKPSRHVLFMRKWENPDTFKDKNTVPPLTGYTPICALLNVPWDKIDACLTHAYVNRDEVENSYNVDNTDDWNDKLDQYPTFEDRKIVMDHADNQKPLAAVWYRNTKTYEQHILGKPCDWEGDNENDKAANFYTLQTTMPPGKSDPSAKGTLVVYELATGLQSKHYDTKDPINDSLVYGGRELVPSIPIGPRTGNGGTMPSTEGTDTPFRRVPYPRSKDVLVTTTGGKTTCEQWVMVTEASSGNPLALGQRLNPSEDDETYTNSQADMDAGGMPSETAQLIEHTVCPWTDPDRQGLAYWRDPTKNKPTKLPTELQLRPASADKIPVEPDMSDVTGHINRSGDAVPAKSDTIYPGWVFGNPMMNPNLTANDTTLPMDSVANTVMVFHVRDTGAYLPVGRNLVQQPELFETAMERKADKCRTDMFIYLIVYGCILFVHMLLTVFRVFGGYFSLGTAMSALTWVAGGICYFWLISMYNDKNAFTVPTD